MYSIVSDREDTVSPNKQYYRALQAEVLRCLRKLSIAPNSHSGSPSSQSKRNFIVTSSFPRGPPLLTPLRTQDFGNKEVGLKDRRGRGQSWVCFYSRRLPRETSSPAWIVATGSRHWAWSSCVKPGYSILITFKTSRLSPKGNELQCCLV